MLKHIIYIMSKERVKIMIDYGRIRSTIKPEERVIDDFSVYLNTDIQEVEVTHEDDTHIEYEFRQVRYSKDEYIKMMAEQNTEMNHLMNTILGVNE